MRTYCTAQGTLHSTLWWATWEGNPKKKAYMYMCKWFTLLWITVETNNIVKQLCCWWWCSVAQLCLTLCDPMDCSIPVLPVPHHLLEFAQVHVHCIGDAFQPSHPLTPSSPSALNLSQHQRKQSYSNKN